MRIPRRAVQHSIVVLPSIHLGPEGGEIVVAGTPEEVAEHPTSHTGRYLKQVLAQHPPQPVLE
jgi:excinuclease ABC subunit A